MKFLLSVAAVIAVAVAGPTQRGLVPVGPAGPTFAPEPIAIGPAIIDSFEPVAIGPAVINPIEGISVGPAIIDGFEPIAVGPAIVEGVEPISVGPAFIDFPLPDGGVAAESVIAPSPVSVVEGVAAEVATGTPLVQLIVNINQVAAASPVSVGPAVAPEFVEIKPDPVQIVESAPEPVQVIEAAPEPVQVIEAAPEPVQVIEVAPVPVEPVQIGVPIIPEAAVVLPEELNSTSNIATKPLRMTI